MDKQLIIIKGLRQLHSQAGPIKDHVLIDMMDYIPSLNEWWCSCGVRLWPDCDISLASVNECFEEHLEKATGDEETVETV